MSARVEVPRVPPAVIGMILGPMAEEELQAELAKVATAA